MKFWRKMLKITLGLLVLFIILVLSMMFKYFTADVNYPYPALGVDISNWFEAFILELMFFMILVGVPLLVDIILMIVSVVKLRKSKSEK